MGKEFQINKYLPVAFLYFFFNGLFLPVGLFYTSILCPLFILWLVYNKKGNLLLWFFALTIPYVLIHLVNGVVIASYLKSYLLLFTVFIFCCCFYVVLKKNNNMGVLFQQLTIWNFIFTVIAIVLLFAGVGNEIWYETNLTPGAKNISRLKMFTTEASVYSLMMAPLALFYYLKLLLFRVKNPFLIFLMITLPLLLSLSFGVILGLFLSIFFIFLSDIKLFFVKKKLPRYLLLLLLFLFSSIVILIYVYPDNLVFKRVVNIFEGNDSSFRGRTTDAFYLGYMIADMKSVLFGAGIGQIKELGLQLLTNYYQHSYTKDLITIPNVTGETIAIFGLFGLLVRLCVIVYLFFKTKVFSNYYRLALFIFIFIYQFTGSYITNIPEYLIWIAAFTTGFHEFDKSAIHKNGKLPHAIQ